MPEEVHKPVNGWTVDTLHEHLDSKIESEVARLDVLVVEKDKQYDIRFEAMVTATQAALNAADRAVNKAETASERRFESVNEFRDTLRDQQSTLMPRSEYTQIHKSLVDRMDVLERMMTRNDGAVSGDVAGSARIMGYIAAAASVCGILILVWHIVGGK